MVSVQTDHPVQGSEENVALIWFSSVDNSSDNSQSIKEDLLAINRLTRFPTDIDECINLIQSITEEKILLILSSDDAFKMLPKISHPMQLYSVFVFPEKNNEHQRLLVDYPVIAGLFDNRASLIRSITVNIECVNRQMEVMAFYNQHQRGSRALTEHSADFLW